MPLTWEGNTVEQVGREQERGSNDMGSSMQMGSEPLWRECREKRVRGQEGDPQKECERRPVRRETAKQEPSKAAQMSLSGSTEGPS